ncbi:autotransporter-associated beta strand repeat-containing protein [Roseimicrobium sp. ORNL1]|uniref:autotransporter-associated beta strand repeat-containing protein n=1 Tax=Roseimicrobium sp. ORNL1 TaxID=2711231 RepID=UPI0013E14146|nr:autotransporter-associated beta strand repeat-containing protein [Roseimicrobium sp. ORNL1]QIF00372.1 PEP-CTERM sorting domain-containing protein [Roseimicrobium sp. ORNL1]
MLVPPLCAETFTWNQTAAGTTYNWNVNGNWTGAVAGFPNVAGDVANVNNDIAGAQTIRLRQDITVGVLNIGDANATTPSNITISNNGAETFRLIFNNGAQPAQLNTTGAGAPTNTVSALMALNSDLLVRLGGADFLTLSGAITTNDNDITFSGGASGVNGVTLSGNITGSGVITNNGLMAVNITGTKTFTGTLVANRGIGASNTGSFTLTSGTMQDAAEIIINGSLSSANQSGGSVHVGNGSGVAANPGQRLTRNTITFNGGTLRHFGQTSNGTWNTVVQDDVNVVRFSSGYSHVFLSSAGGTAGTTLNVTTLQRSAGASVYVSSSTLAVTAKFLAGNGSSLLLGGGGGADSSEISILPWMTATNTNGFGPSSNTFATYTANGIRGLNITTEYASSITAGATHNVNTSTLTIAGPTTVNALRHSSGGTSNIGAGQILTVASGGVMFSTNNGAIGGTSNASAGTLNFGSAEGVVWSNDANNNTIGAVIAGSNGLTKAGSGTLIISGANTYSGNTYVGGGTLQVGIGGVGRTGTGDVLMNARGTTLAGTGTVQASTILTYGKISPGDTAGTGVGTLSINGGLSLTPLDDSQGPLVTVTELTILNSTTSDKIVIGQDLTLNAAARIVVTFDAGYTATVGDTWDLLDWAGVLALNGYSTGANLRTGADDASTNLDLPTLTGGLVWNISNVADGGSLRLTIEGVPEPSRAMLLMAGVSAMVLRRRR